MSWSCTNLGLNVKFRIGRVLRFNLTQKVRTFFTNSIVPALEVKSLIGVVGKLIVPCCGPCPSLLLYSNSQLVFTTCGMIAGCYWVCVYANKHQSRFSMINGSITSIPVVILLFFFIYVLYVWIPETIYRSYIIVVSFLTITPFFCKLYECLL